MMPMVVFDLETGGLEPHHPNIQIAAIALDSCGEEVETFHYLIQFNESSCDPAALALNHYDPERWALHAKQPPVVRDKFADFLRRHSHVEMVSKRTGRPYTVAQLAGYNAATFDGPRLKAMFFNCFLPAHPRILCVLQRVLWVSQEDPLFCPPDYKLGTVAKAMGIDPEGAHDALADVRLTIAVMRQASHATRKMAS